MDLGIKNKVALVAGSSKGLGKAMAFQLSREGAVVEGEMSLTIGEKTRVYRKGDWYYIPEGVVHSATFLTRVNVIDVFDDPERYKIKKS